MNAHITGLHHLTAICGDPRRNYNFYTGVLGLRLVKKTVNFDDPGTYHRSPGKIAASLRPYIAPQCYPHSTVANPSTFTARA